MFVGATVMVSTILSSHTASADNNTSAVDQVNITVPVSCTLSGTGMDSHNAEINNGQYNSNIGTTTLKAFCNDNEGFAIYAIGYTDNEDHKNVLTNPTLGSSNDIVTGTATTGNSQWAMKLTAQSNPTPTYPLTIQNNYNNYHTVPSNYELVAKRTSATDIGSSAEGSTLTSTYQVYISPTQAAGTYTGQVKYVMVHPNNHDAPIANPAILDTGQTVNTKLKSLAATIVNGEETTITPEFDDLSSEYDYYDEYIKSINVHLETPAPSGFTPTEANTISSSASVKPIYIVFDNTNDAGIMHFYTEGERIVLSPDSSYMFYYLYNLASITGISDWDTSSVTNMSYMFSLAGYSATTWSIGDLSSWNTSSVTSMSNMFNSAGRSATTFSLDLSSWNTSSVTVMSSMFYQAGYSATTFSLGNLSSWDTSNVTNMNGMFNSAGHSATTFSLGNLSSWDTSNVTNMNGMFNSAGHSATTWSIGDLSSWDTSNVTDMGSMFDYAGFSATTWSIGDLSSWDTSNVISMGNMFSYAGYSATTFSLNLSSWDTSNVTYMGSMFSYVGYSATTWSVTIPQTNGNNINNATNRLYGQTASIYATPPSGKSFTLAQ